MEIWCPPNVALHFIKICPVQPNMLEVESILLVVKDIPASVCFVGFSFKWRVFQGLRLLSKIHYTAFWHFYSSKHKSNTTLFSITANTNAFQPPDYVVTQLCLFMLSTELPQSQPSCWTGSFSHQTGLAVYSRTGWYLVDSDTPVCLHVDYLSPFRVSAARLCKPVGPGHVLHIPLRCKL